MIAGESFLCFAPGPWDDLWRNRHQIMTRLAQENKVLWVEPWRSLRAALRSPRRRWLPTVRQVRAHLWVVNHPDLLPTSSLVGLRHLSVWVYDTWLRRLMAKLGMHHPILWLYQPEQVRTIGRYGEKLVVYHVVDEYTAYAGIPVDYRKLMMAYEQHLLRQADVVIVTAPALQETRASLARHLYVVPNAVDYDAFQAILSSRRSPTIPLPSTRPLLGYVGAINDKLDYDLLAAVAIARPEWTLLMVGMQDVRVPEDREGLHRLVALPNVRLLGPVPVHEVPLVMAACDVCLLPYKRNQRTRAISSLKLYEYLACGRPVVATDIPAAHEAGDVVTIAQDLPSFIAGIARALQDAPGAAEARRHVAAQNTWQQRMEQISAILLSVLSQRGG